MLKGAEIVLRCLRAEGVDLVFGYPGGAIMPLYDALEGSGVRHILTNSLGGKSNLIVPNVGHVHLHDGDRILLSTDGLTDELSDDEIADTFRRNLTPQATCDALVQLALEHGGRDNVTTLVARYRFGDGTEEATGPRQTEMTVG